MQVKGWWQSKTVIFNVLWLVVVVAGLLGYGQFTPSPEVQQIGAILGLVIPLLINIILRFKTTKPIV